ncbi:ABC transporter substrate-binding protein [Streptomyces tsukubensis]|uniref:Amino acid ABC transporter substrate-binding protein n=1 Tax=Streptomyces tsukubensis TaxID=83656 RepID=A0A1V4A5A8_9ACTN|nr:ABC transporter substrate-binding protein [Streptomyces tsukubensis]OON75563.1 amino acid ABC transporter substrate-binding protein [Streptomyces tsukubensis]QFR95053.1 amino acid ABC transporter substrate-binding protein [Streptomyces tsukubensis]
MSMNSRRVRTAGAVLGALSLAAGLTACGGDSLEDSGKGSGKSSGDSGGKKGSLVIGAARFTEAKVMAELYARILGDAGYDATVKTVQNREVYEPELRKGKIDIVPEYAATVAEYLNLAKNGPDAKPVASSDADATFAALQKLAEPAGLKALPHGEAVDQNAFAVTEAYAKQHDLKTLSDLGEAKLKVKVAAGDECETRPFCGPGLKSKYGIDVTGIDPKGVGTPQAKQAVKNGSDQLVLTTTTDASLKSYGLVILDDDKKLQNADNILPLVNAKDAGGKAIADVLDKLTKTLTTQDLVELNRKVDAEREKEKDVASDYLTSKGLIKK